MPVTKRQQWQQDKNMGVSLTEKAVEHVADYLASRGKGVGIRIAVKTTGCGESFTV